MKPRPMIRTALVFMLCGLLAGCGFHLRGWHQAGLGFHQLHIVNDSHDRQVAIDLVKAMHTRGVDVTPHAKTTLRILSSRYHQQIMSISSSTRIHQYRLSYSVRYVLKTPQHKTTSQLTATRTLTIDSQQRLGSTQRSHTLRHELRQELVAQWLAQLAAERQGI
jgi:LPS-assembly lipoprotein